MEYKVKLLPPLMPNFISIEGSELKIEVSQLTDEEARQYGELMKYTFIQHHKEHIARNTNSKTITN